MYDPRVRRGSTVVTGDAASSPMGASGGPSSPGPLSSGTVGSKAGARTTRGTAASATTQDLSQSSTVFRRTTRGIGSTSHFVTAAEVAKAHEEVDLTPFLTEAPRTVTAVAVATQTDAFAALPPPAPYVPLKTGVDASTQIEPEDGLFQFDLEVEPLLDTLVGKTLEQALLEVEEEAELTDLFGRRHALENAKRDDERRVRDMEAKAQEDLRRRQAKLQAARARAALGQQCTAKVGALAVARALTQRSVAGAFDDLNRRQQFRNVVAALAEVSVLPAMVADAQAHLERHVSARRCVDDLIRAALARQATLQAEEDVARARRAEEAAKQKRYTVSIIVQGVPKRRRRPRAPDEPEPPVPTLVVGPIPIARVDSVLAVETRIRAWIAKNPSELAEEVLRGRILRLAFDGAALDERMTLEHLSVDDFRRLELLNLPDPDAPPAADDDDDDDGDGSGDGDDGAGGGGD